MSLCDQNTHEKILIFVRYSHQLKTNVTCFRHHFLIILLSYLSLAYHGL